MRRKMASVVAGICVAATMLTGCASEISNDYVTVSQYKGIEVKKVEPIEVTDESVETEINNMLASAAEYKEVTGRAAQLGDTATIDYVGKKDGVAFDNGSDTDYPLELGSATFIEGFEDGIVGHKVGETFDLNLTFPESYGSSELAGQDVVFTVTLKKLTEKVIPEPTDEWVQSISETSKTVEEYKVELKEMMTTYYEESAKGQMETELWDTFMANVTVNSYDTEELQGLIKNYQEQYQKQAEAYGMELEDYLEIYASMDLDGFNAEISTMAKEQLKEKYATELVIEKAKIDVSEEKLREVYEEYAEYFGAESVDALIEAMEKDGLLESLQQLAKSQITRDWMMENCKYVESSEK